MSRVKFPIQLEEFQNAATESKLLDELLKREVVMAFPLMEADKLLGLVVLSGRISGTSYSPEERSLVTVLANQFVTALTTARFYVEAVQKRQMDEELQMAQQIQAGLLPKVLPDNDHFQLAAHSEPSRTVGGDFYDYLPIDEHRFGLVIADACGKGMPAAMLISQIQAIIKNEAGHGRSIRQMMINLNHHVIRYTSAKNFATLVYGIFNRRTGIFEFANAGHFHPILVRKDGRVEYLKTTGPALGILSGADYQIERVRFSAGDCLLFYTDGITETLNGAGEEYGDQSLQQTLIRHRGCSVQDIIHAITTDLRAYHSSEHVQDDRTLMAFKVLTQDETLSRRLES